MSVCSSLGAAAENTRMPHHFVPVKPLEFERCSCRTLAWYSTVPPNREHVTNYPDFSSREGEGRASADVGSEAEEALVSL